MESRILSCITIVAGPFPIVMQFILNGNISDLSGPDIAFNIIYYLIDKLLHEFCS